jgi:hypothetical protein
MTTCPYCNTPLLAELTGHVICPRCGETVRSVDAEGTPARPVAPLASTPSVRSNSQLAAMILAVMLLMASIALIYALYTTRFRRANDTKGQEKPALPGPPTALLGYIPDDVHVLCGIDVAQLRRSDAGQALLRQFNIADEVLIGPRVDRVVVGLNMKEMLPRFTVVARSAAPGEFSKPEMFQRSAFKLRGGQTLQKIALLGFGHLDAWITEPDANTLVGTQLPSDFDVIPDPPRSGTDRFTHLHALLAERRDDNATAWLVGELEPDSTVLAQLLKLAPADAIDAKTWQELRGAALALRTQRSDLLLRLDLQARNPAATRAIAERIERSLTDAGAHPKRTADGDWQRLTATLSAEALGKWRNPR